MKENKKLLSIRYDHIKYLGNNVLGANISIGLKDERDLISYNRKMVDSCQIELRIYNLLIGRVDQPIKKVLGDVLYGGPGGPIGINFVIDQSILRQIGKKRKKDKSRRVRKYIPVDINIELFFSVINNDLDPFTDKNLISSSCSTEGMLSELDWINMNHEMDYRNWMIIKATNFLKRHQYLLLSLSMMISIFYYTALLDIFIRIISYILSGIGTVGIILATLITSSIVTVYHMRPILNINIIPETDYIFFNGHNYRYMTYKIIVENNGRSASKNCKADILHINNIKRRIGWENVKREQDVIINKKGYGKVNFCAFLIDDNTYIPGMTEDNHKFRPPNIIFSDENGWSDLSSSDGFNNSFVNGIQITSENADPVYAMIDIDIDKKKIDIFPCNYRDLKENADNKLKKFFGDKIKK